MMPRTASASLRVEDVAAVAVEAVAHGIVDGIDGNDRLLRGADDAVVEGLRHQDGGDGALLVGGLVDHHRRVARADADGGRAGRVGRMHHARPAGGQNQFDRGMAHQLIGELDGRLVDPADDVLRSARVNRGLQHQAGGNAGALARARMWAE